jgi:hypothetical protein
MTSESKAVMPWICSAGRTNLSTSRRIRAVDSYGDALAKKVDTQLIECPGILELRPVTDVLHLYVLDVGN